MAVVSDARAAAAARVEWRAGLGCLEVFAIMNVVIYKITRQGGLGVKFEGQDGTSFIDPNGLRNPQLSKIVGSNLMKYVRCDVGNGVAEVLGEASEEEVAAFGGRGKEERGNDEEPEGPFKFPGR